MRILFILFIIIPVLEMWLLIQVGSFIGAMPTIALVLLTAMIGVALLKQQGLQTLLSANRKVNEGQIPLSEIGEGIMLAVAGALLLTPGFVTDCVGFLLLTPPVRKAMIRQWSGTVMAQTMKAAQQQNQGGVFYSYTEVRGRQRRPGSRTSRDVDVIEGEFQELDKDDDSSRR